MADNVVITPGVGSTIGADEVADATLGTVHIQYVKLMDGTIDGTNKGVINANGLKVDGSGVTQPVSAASLPLPTGAATAAKQPALGTAGSASADVISVQGIASMTPLQAAQNGTWTVQPGNTANTTAWKVQLYDGTTALPVLAGSTGSPAASAPALAVSVRDANANGAATSANSAPIVPATDWVGTTALSKFSTGYYVTVAASQTAQVLQSSAGATGDYISGILVIPASTSPGNVILLDNATSITVFSGGASSVSNAVPFFIPLGAVSRSGAWKLTTGASVSCVAVGKFS